MSRPAPTFPSNDPAVTLQSPDGARATLLLHGGQLVS